MVCDGDETGIWRSTYGGCNNRWNQGVGLLWWRWWGSVQQKLLAAIVRSRCKSTVTQMSIIYHRTFSLGQNSLGSGCGCLWSTREGHGSTAIHSGDSPQEEFSLCVVCWVGDMFRWGNLSKGGWPALSSMSLSGHLRKSWHFSRKAAGI